MFSRLSIPFIGIFVLYRLRLNLLPIGSHDLLSIPFIGIFVLYHYQANSGERLMIIIFQFPLLGFLFCIATHYVEVVCLVLNLSIPFIGIFVLYPPNQTCVGKVDLKCLSIPFIGIFVLYRTPAPGTKPCWTAYSFNSLYWDFCSVSMAST